jgi:ABC-2 type transport system permease protein
VNVREATNSFTYGGNFLTQYPLDIFAGWFRRLFAFVIPIADRQLLPGALHPRQADGAMAPALRFASPLVALASVAVAAIVWRAGVRRYTSRGS